jgi:DNA-binding transcriptional ArsR family regulator
MSQIAREWVLSIEDQDLNGTRRLVLYLLAEHHNGETGDCFPGRELLAREAGTTPRAVTRALNWLKDAGYVKSARRHRENGSRSSNGYVLTGLSDAGVTLDDEDAGLSDVRGQSKVTFEVIQGDAGVTPITGREPEGEQEGDVSGSSYVACKKTSTSTSDVVAAGVEKELLGQPPPASNQGQSSEENPPSSLAESEPSGPSDEAELNDSGKEGGARAAPDLPAEVQDVLAKFRGLDRFEVIAKWRRHLNEDVSHEATLALRRYCELRVGNDWTDPLKPHEAAARALPEAERRFTRPLEAVA